MTDPLQHALHELDAHVGQFGWDQPARLYALVPTAELLVHEPGLAEVLGIEGEPEEWRLTPVEQELPADQQLERVLETIEWPEAVAGCAVALERLVLPPTADGEMPEDDVEAADFARSHPDRQEVRITAGALRDQTSYALLRLRAHDEEPVGGTDLVPGLQQLLALTLTDAPGAAADEEGRP